MSASSGASSVRSCTAYALSQKIRKSGAAAGIAASRRTVSSEYTVPSGLLYFGTHQMPFTAGSAAASRSQASRSGPDGVIGTLIIPMPNRCSSAKCRS